MTDTIQQTKMLAESHALVFKDCGNGHVQISGHGVLVNYWPESKRRRAHIVGHPTAESDCTPWDAVQLCLKSGKPGLKPKKKNISKNGPAFDLKPLITKGSAKHVYHGPIPPWEFKEFVFCGGDGLRFEAYQLECQALEMDVGE